MTNLRGLILVIGIGLSEFAYSNGIPAVNLDKAVSAITVAGEGFSAFQPGLRQGSAEPVAWLGGGDRFANRGAVAGTRTEPGTVAAFDESASVTMEMMAYGVFASNPASLLPAQISPARMLISLVATAGIPDSGSTIILLGLALIGLAFLARRFSRAFGRKPESKFRFRFWRL